MKTKIEIIVTHDKDGVQSVEYDVFGSEEYVPTGASQVFAQHCAAEDKMTRTTFATDYGDVRWQKDRFTD